MRHPQEVTTQGWWPGGFEHGGKTSGPQSKMCGCCQDVFNKTDQHWNQSSRRGRPWGELTHNLSAEKQKAKQSWVYFMGPMWLFGSKLISRGLHDSGGDGQWWLSFPSARQLGSCFLNRPRLLHDTGFLCLLLGKAYSLASFPSFACSSPSQDFTLPPPHEVFSPRTIYICRPMWL